MLLLGWATFVRAQPTGRPAAQAYEASSLPRWEAGSRRSSDAGHSWWGPHDARRWIVAPDTLPAPRDVRSTAWPVLASALLPGAGQALRRERRALLYLAIEAFAFTNHSTHRRGARRTRDGYRTLAATVARSPFAEVRPNGDFAYYERMMSYVASGRFDLSGGTRPLEPEIDTVTFNGATWLLARRTYWTDPAQPPPRGSVEWVRAEAFYLQRAVRPNFRWSWEGASADYDRFRQLIQRSNDQYRAALSNLGLALGNHVLSAIDASIAVRLDQRRTLSGREYVMTVQVPLDLGR